MPRSRIKARCTPWDQDRQPSLAIDRTAPHRLLVPSPRERRASLRFHSRFQIRCFHNERRISARDKTRRDLLEMASADVKVHTVEDEGFEDIVDIQEKPLDIMRYIDAVRDSSAGAIATFSGTTRDTFEGQEVLELRYEAYESMAYRELGRICHAARERWDLKRMAVAHRTGVVAIGEESVFIAVSSVHRQAALKACQFVIDEIKASVPIWKKEIYNNGESWKRNSEFLTRSAT